MKVRHHHLKRPLVIAAAILGAAVPATSAAGEPKNDVPFIAATSTRPVAGEQKNVGPFTASEPPLVQIVQGPGGFDWGDAGVGAAGAFGLMLLAGGVVIVSRQSTAGTA